MEADTPIIREHDPANPDCPWNDPETSCNPAVAGLPCRCKTVLEKAAKDAWNVMHPQLQSVFVGPLVTVAKCEGTWDGLIERMAEKHATNQMPKPDVPQEMRAQSQAVYGDLVHIPVKAGYDIIQAARRLVEAAEDGHNSNALLMRLQETVRKVYPASIPSIFETTLAQMSEADMAKLGWVRATKITKAIEDGPANVISAATSFCSQVFHQEHEFVQPELHLAFAKLHTAVRQIKEPGRQ